MPKVIGLTGSLGSGKSTVAKMFQRLGAKIIDADDITHDLIASQGECFKAIIKEFGEEVLLRGEINRRKLGDIVFKDFKKLKKLESIIHPVVRKRILEEIRKFKSKSGIVILSVPLFFEGGYQRYVELTIVVTADQHLRVKRACQRLKISKSEALRRNRRQMSQRQKIPLGDMIIDNNQTLKHTEKQVRELWQHLKTLK